MSAFADCPSPPHRAVLGLLSVAMGAPPDAELDADLRGSLSEDLVQIATFHYLHTVLATAFDRQPDLCSATDADAVIFFSEMQAENARRNAQVEGQLNEIGTAFADAGIEVVALKGAAGLISPVLRLPQHRFLSDLDLLLPEAMSKEALDVLAGLGAQVANKPDARLAGRHHLPPLWSDRWPVPVELHIQTGRPEIEAALPASAVRKASRAHSNGLRVPAAHHRLAHLILHAQHSEDRGRRNTLSPRDCLEAQAMIASIEPEAVEQAQSFVDPDLWGGFTDVADALLLGQPPQSEWGRTAFRNFGRPDLRRVEVIVEQLKRTVWQSLTSRRGVADILAH